MAGYNDFACVRCGDSAPVAGLIKCADGTLITAEGLQHMLRDQGIFLLCDRCYFREAVAVAGTRHGRRAVPGKPDPLPVAVAGHN